MNIGFDLDKIFINYPPFVPDVLIDKLYKQESNGVLSYRIPSKPEQLLRTLTHHPLLRPPIKKNIEYVKKLNSRNTHKYYLISSRFSFLKNRTQTIIQKYGLNTIFDGLYFNFGDKQPHIFKNETIKILKIDLYVDDDLRLLQHLAKDNTKAKFFWLNKKQTKSFGKNLFAITHLSEMFPTSTSEESILLASRRSGPPPR